MAISIGRVKAANSTTAPVGTIDPVKKVADTVKKVAEPVRNTVDKMKTAWTAFEAMNPVMAKAASLTPVGVAVRVASKAGEKVKDRVLANINPIGYDTDRRGRSASFTKRIIDGLILDKKEPLKKEMEKKAPAEYIERQDLLSLYLGRKQKNNSIGISSYRPTVGDNPKHQYVTSALAEGKIRQGVAEIANIKSNSLEEIKGKVLAAIKSGTMGIPESGKGGFHVKLPAMNEATMDVGEDEKGYYISYSDRWDINPIRGTASILKKSPKAAAIAKHLGVSAVEDINPIGRPVNIYGRVYINKKTGKVIK